MAKPWYRRKQHGPLGYTYPVSWKGWAHLLGSLMALLGFLALSTRAGLHPTLVALGTLLLLLAVAAIGFAKTEYVEV